MADPSFRVAPALLNHLHLISDHKFAYQAHQLAPDRVLEYLRQAPRIIKEIQSVTWQFLTPPACTNGTVFLAFQPTAQRGSHFATDGYIWAEPEASFTTEVQGYLIESLVQQSGFAPGVEQVATHSRIRSRLLRGPPNQPSADPQLEIVQYIQARPEHRVQSQMIRPSPQNQKLFMERQQLQRQGPLMRKQFMFSDSANWPAVAMPGAQPYAAPGMMGRPGMPPQMAHQQGHPQQMFHPQQAGMRPGSMGAGPSPAKRARTGTMSQPGGAHRGSTATAVEAPEVMDERPAEEMLDMLSPREISVTRYKQHHEWMEEVLSAYDTRDILPVGLGLGLTGELAAITKGILDEKDADHDGNYAFKQPSADEVKELEKRVTAWQKQRQEEMAEMKRQHAQNVSEMSQQKLFAKLERELAQAAAGDAGEVERVAAEAEKASPAAMLGHDEVVRMAKGGLLGKGEEVPGQAMHANGGGVVVGGGDEGNGGMGLGEAGGDDMFGDLLDNTAGEELDFYSNNYEDSLSFPA